MTKRKGPQDADPKYKQSNSKPLPDSLEERIALALEKIKRPTCRRVLQYIAAHPDSWTHHIALECSCGNAPDIVMNMRGILAQYGVMLHCYLPPREKRLTTKFGEKSAVHKWRALAINDPSRDPP